LSRNVHELRKVLDDDPNNPNYIETLPRRGYRFVASVKEVSDPQVNEAPLPISSGEEVTGTTLIEKHTFAKIVTEESLLPASPVIQAEAKPEMLHAAPMPRPF